MDRIVKEKIEFQIDDIDRLFVEFELIFKKVEYNEPDLFDMTILGSVFYSFYK